MGNLFSVSNQTETFVRFLKESGPVPPPGPTPGPTPDPSNPEYWNAATGDGLFAIVSVLLAIAICAFGFFIWKKHKNGTLKIRKETFFGDSIALISSSHIAKLLIILVASCLLVFGCFGISHAAEKLSGGSFEVTNVDAIFDVNSDIFDNTGATEVDAGSNVLKAYGTDAIDVSQYVDVIVSEDETVALKYGSGYIKNDASEALMVHGLTVEGLETSADAVKWTIKSGEQTLYEGVPGTTSKFPAILINPGEQITYSLSADESVLTHDLAWSLTDKNVLKISYQSTLGNYLAEPTLQFGWGLLEQAFQAQGFDPTFATEVDFLKDATPQTYRFAADLSDAQNQGIMAYVVDDEVANAYKVIITSQSGIKCKTKSLASFFRGFHNLYKVDYSNLDTTENTDFSYMFAYTGRVDGLAPTISLPENFIKAPGSDLSYMFFSSNNSVDLTGLNTANVVSMEAMFHNYCYGILDKDRLQRVTLTLGNEDKPFKIYEGTNVFRMFDGCNYWLSPGPDSTKANVIEQIDISNLKSTEGMFYNYLGVYRYETEDEYDYCLDVSSLNTTNVESMAKMFAHTFDNNLEGVIYFGDDEDKFVAAPDCSGMFENCDTNKLDLSHVDFSKTNNMTNMFKGYSGPGLFDPTVEKSITFPDEMEVADNCDLSYMFSYACVNTDIFHHINGAKVSSMKGMFENFGYEQVYTVKKYTFSISFPEDFNVKDNCDVSAMFKLAKTDVNLTNFATSNLTDFSEMFKAYGLYVLTGVSWQAVYKITFPEGGLQTGNNANFYAMFKEAQLNEFTLNDVDISKAINLSEMFMNMGLVYQISIVPVKEAPPYAIFKLTVNAGSENAPLITAANSDMSYMFAGWKTVSGGETGNKLDLTNLSFNNAKDLTGMFKDFNNNPQAKFVNIDSPLNSVNLVLPTTKPGEGTTDKKVVLDSMFEGALAFNSLNETTTTGFYELVLSLTSIDTSNAVSMNSMFKNACIYSSEGSYSYDGLGFIEKLVRPVIDVTGGNINKVDDMSHMFDNAFPHDDARLDISITASMYCSQLGKLKLWGSEDAQKTAENCDGSYMFSKVGVQEINLENVNFVNISDYSFMFSFFGFYEYPGAIEPLKKLTMTNATSVRGIFYEAYFNYKDWEEEGFKLDLSNWDVSEIKDMSYMFYGLKCTKLILDNGEEGNKHQYWDFSNVENMEGMFMNFGYNPYIIEGTLGVGSEIVFPTVEWTPGSKTGGKGCNMRMMFAFCSCDLHLEKMRVNYANDVTGMFLAYGSDIATFVNFIKSLLPNPEKLEANGVLYATLNGDPSLANDLIDKLTDPVINDVNNSVKGVTKATQDSLSPAYSNLEQAKASLVSPQTTDPYSSDGLEQVGLTSDVLGEAINEANFDALSSDYYNNELLSYPNEAFAEYKEQLKAELADAISNCDVLDMISFEELSQEYGSSQPNLFTYCRRVFFPTKSGQTLPFAPGTSLSKPISAKMMFMLYNSMNYQFTIEDKEVDCCPDLSGFNTSNINDMSYMFTGFMFCLKIKMFNGESPVTVLDLSSFDTSKVTSMLMMLAFTGSVNQYVDEEGTLHDWYYGTKIKFGPKFTLQAVKDCRFMFMWCRAKDVDMSSITVTTEAGGITNTRNMFALACIENLDLSGWDTSHVNDMRFMFSLYGVLARFVDGVVSYDDTFNKSEWYGNIIIGQSEEGEKTFKINKDTQIFGMFFITALKNLDLTNVDVSSRTSLARMFEFAMSTIAIEESLDVEHTLDISTWDTSQVLDYKFMFTLASFNDIKLPRNSSEKKFKIAQGADLSYMFFLSLSSQKQLNIYTRKYFRTMDLSFMEISNASNLRSMFFGYCLIDGYVNYQGLIKLGDQTIDLCQDMSHMFEFSGMGVDLSGVNTANVKKLDRMFAMMGYGGRFDVERTPEGGIGIETTVPLSFYAHQLILPEPDSEGGAAFKLAEGATSNFMFAGTYTGNFENPIHERDYFVSIYPTEINTGFMESSKVKSMEGMFMLTSCSVNLQGFDTRKSESLKMMFMGYGAIPFLALNDNHEIKRGVDTMSKLTFDTKAVSKFKICANTKVAFMFSAVFAQPDSVSKGIIDLNSINVSDVKNFDWMFALGSGVVNFDISSWSFANATSLNFTFVGYGLLARIPDVIFSLDKEEEGGLFFNVNYLVLPKNLTVSEAGCDSVGMFGGATIFKYSYNSSTKAYTIESNLDLSGWEFEKFSWCYAMFAGYNFPVRSFGDKKVVSTEAANIDFGEHSFADDADLTSMFAFASANLDFSDFDLSNAWSMNSMFAFYGAANIDDPTTHKTTHAWKIKFPTEGIKFPEGCSARQMFFGCFADEIDVSKFDTENLTDTSRMFALCEAMHLDVSKFNSTNFVDVSGMFAGASAQELDLSGWSFSKVEDMNFMFAGWGSNTNFTWGTDYESELFLPEDMSVSENGCTAVGMFMAVNTRQLLLYGFNTEHIYAADYMFAFADTLEVINVDDGTDWYKDGATFMSGNGMFLGCKALVGQNKTFYTGGHIGLSYARVDTPSKHGYFTSTHSLRENDEGKSIFLKVDGKGFTADELAKVKEVDFTIGDVSQVTGQDLSYSKDGSIMAAIKDGVLTVTSSGTIYTRPNSLVNMFSNGVSEDEDAGELFAALETVNFGGVVASANSTSASGMFANCINMVSLDISELSFTNVKDVSYMFYNFGKSNTDGATLTLYNNSKVWVPYCTNNYSHMFAGANITNLDLTKLLIYPDGKDSKTAEKSVDMSNMFEAYLGNSIKFPTEEASFCPPLESIKVKYDSMFANIPENSKLTSIDISSFAPDKTDTANNMFAESAYLQTIYANEDYLSCDWSTTKLSPDTSVDMFKNCNKLRGSDGQGYDPKNVNCLYARPDHSKDAKESKPGYFSIYVQLDWDVLFENIKKTLAEGNVIKEVQYINKEPENYIPVCDVSLLKDNSAMLYMVSLGPANNGANNISLQVYSNKRILIINEIKKYIEIFNTCNKGITYANLENLYFNTPINNIKEVSQMFKDYQMLEKIEFGNNREGIFEGVQVFDEMFVNCGNLKNIDVASWFKDNEKHEFNIVSATGMFNDCSNLQRIYCKYKETWKIEKDAVMFHRCNSLVGGVEKFVGDEYSIRAKDGVDSDTPGYFTSASILKNADVSNSRSIFQDAKTINDTSKELEPLEVMIPAIQKVVFATLYDNYDMNRPYYLLSDEGASHPVLADTNYNWEYGLTLTIFSSYIDTRFGYVPNKIYANETSLYAMFRGFESLNSIEIEEYPADLGGGFVFDSSYAKTTKYMFESAGIADGENGYTELNIANLDTSNVEDFSYMFYNCKAGSVTLSAGDNTKFTLCSAKNTSHMFENFGLDLGITSSHRYISYLYWSKKDGPTYSTASNCDASYMFYNSHVKQLDVTALQMDNISNFNYMFSWSGVYEIPEPKKLSNGEEPIASFAEAYEKRDVSSLEQGILKTAETWENVGASAMFPGEIYFNNDKQWASNVESATMEGMFEACLYGEQGTDENIGLDMSGFNCTNVTNMVETFAYTPFFTNINLGPEDQFDTAKCKNMDGMFRFCGSLNSTGNIYNTTAGDEKHFPTFTFSTDTIVTSMFQGANIPVDLTNAKSIPEAADGVSGLSVISDYSRMFCDYGFYVLPKILDRRGEIFLNIDLVKSGDTWTPPDGSTMEEMFRGCKANVDLSALDVKNVTNFYAMFMSFGNIDQLDILEFKPGEITWPSKWKTNTENVIDMSCMFKGYKGKDNLSELFTENFETSNVVNMSEMFRGCKVLKLDLSNFNTAKVVDMSYMFSNEFLRPSYLTEVTFGDNFINENSVVKDMSYMFGSAIVDNEYLNIINCNADWAEIIEANGIACEGMFAGCRELAGNGNNSEIATIYDPDHVTYEYAKPSYKDTDGVIHKGYFTGTPKNLVGVKVLNNVESLSDVQSLTDNEANENQVEEAATDEPVVVDDGEVVELNNEEAIQPLIESVSFAILNVLNPAGFTVYNLFEFVINLWVVLYAA